MIVAQLALCSAGAWFVMGAIAATIHGLRLPASYNPVLVVANMTNTLPSYSPFGHWCWHMAWLSWQIAGAAFIIRLVW